MNQNSSSHGVPERSNFVYLPREHLSSFARHDLKRYPVKKAAANGHSGVFKEIEGHHDRRDREAIEREIKAERERTIKTGTKLFEKGVNAVKEGDFKKAFVFFTGCQLVCLENPIYTLNRAAVSLELKVYKGVIIDTRMALEKADAAAKHGPQAIEGFDRSKAYYISGQALFHMGEWARAERTLVVALLGKPGDPEIMNAIRTLHETARRCKCKEDHARWVAQQGEVDLDDLFAPGELEKAADEASGMNREECLRRIRSLRQ
ncbi:hypothetical protein B0H16DRAFT_1725796 [Mycena metata]|uniref:TPR-like protein n=1 Tax=Mycena metata TaxID=1033252 RepID=A0AAD7IPI1_9AGAR|nr:hypothetical protein B0H16DRAFT_1725796 [Mycena metata]